jgi:hypothetical protein
MVFYRVRLFLLFFFLCDFAHPFFGLRVAFGFFVKICHIRAGERGALAAARDLLLPAARHRHAFVARFPLRLSAAGAFICRKIGAHGAVYAAVSDHIHGKFLLW